MRWLPGQVIRLPPSGVVTSLSTMPASMVKLRTEPAGTPLSGVYRPSRCGWGDRVPFSSGKDSAIWPVVTRSSPSGPSRDAAASDAGVSRKRSRMTSAFCSSGQNDVARNRGTSSGRRPRPMEALIARSAAWTRSLGTRPGSTTEPRSRSESLSGAVSVCVGPVSVTWISSQQDPGRGLFASSSALTASAGARRLWIGTTLPRGRAVPRAKGGDRMAKKADAPEAPIEKEVRKLRKLIKSTRIAMFTTVASDGRLRSRPMANLKGGFDGDLWFVTRSTAPKTEEIKDNQHVNVAYTDTEDERFVSISGLASLVRDPAKVEDLWSRRLRAWFPGGKKDPDLALIRVRIDRAEVWDSKTSTMVHLEGLGAVLAT